MSIVIAFMALTAFLLLVSRWFEEAPEVEVLGCPSRVRSRRVYASWAVAMIVIAFGIYDQTSPADFTPAYRSFASDRKFVGGLEAKLVPDAMVYQLPYERFPEGGNQFRMETYGPARGFLQSRSLRWSFGQVKGREGDRWMLALSGLPLARQMDIASRSGFSAVVLDRRGYPDAGKAAEGELRGKLGVPLAESEDGQLVAYRIEPTGSQPVPLNDLIQPLAQPTR
jgi:phosphoglycerol transferase